MGFESFIARRYLLSRQKHSFISIISLISVIGVALGVAALIVVIGVMNGFSTDLRDKILGVNAHVVIMSLGGGMPEHEHVAQLAMTLDGVEAATPFIYSEVMVSSPSGVKGVVLRGIDSESASRVLTIERDMRYGKLEDINNPEGPPKIIIGQELAVRLHLDLGSRINLLSPTGRHTAAGFTPKVMIFEVAGIFKTGMYEYDTSLAYVTLDSAKKILGFEEVDATGVELKLTDIDAADVISNQLRDKLGPAYYIENWKEMNAQLFAALKLEKTAMFIILTMIVLVGSFSIITTLVMLVMEKTRDIAVLMSMGAKRESVRRIFIRQGVIIGLVGTGLGYGLGLTACLLLKKYQFIKLPENVYSLDHLPVRLDVLDMSLIGLAAMGLCFLATVYPAWKAARLNPVEALRFE